MTDFEALLGKTRNLWEDGYLGVSAPERHNLPPVEESIYLFFKGVVQVGYYARSKEYAKVTVEKNKLIIVEDLTAKAQLTNFFVKASGDNPSLTKELIENLASSFLAEANGGLLFANSSHVNWNSWRPVTGHTKDFLFGYINMSNIRFLLSTLDE